MTQVEDMDLLFLLQHAVDHAIDVRVATVQQMPEAGVLGSGRTPIRSFFQAKDFSLEALKPPEGCRGFACVNVLEDQSQIPFGSRREFNEISHAFS
jgi:hypothetical protein